MLFLERSTLSSEKLWILQQILNNNDSEFNGLETFIPYAINWEISFSLG